MEDISHRARVVSLTCDTGTPEDPMILLVKEVRDEDKRLALSRPEAVLLPPREGVTPFKAEFRAYAQKLSTNMC